jgi:hypothetical protein
MDGHRVMMRRFNGINIQYVLLFSKLFKFTFFKKSRGRGQMTFFSLLLASVALVYLG